MKSMPPNLNDALQAHQTGNLVLALKYYQALLKVEPAHAQALAYSGICQHQLGNTAAGLEKITQAIELEPDNPDWLYNKALMLQESERYQEAISRYKALLEKNPKYTTALNNLGLCYKLIDKIDSALTYFKQSISLNEKNPSAYNNLGTVYKLRKQLKDAEVCFLKALKHDAKYVQALHNLALLKREQGDKIKALTYFQKAYQLDPNVKEAACCIARIKEELCDWSTRDQDEILLKDMLNTEIAHQETIIMQPFQSLARGYDNQTLVTIAKNWSDKTCLTIPEKKPTLSYNPTPKKLRIGYASADFCNHATLHLMQRLFYYHDKTQFEIYAYDYSEGDDSEHRQFVINQCDQFTSIHTLENEKAAHTIANDGIHILVDLKGYTKDNRLSLLAHRPAPITASYLGFPGSLGASFVDYLITDNIVTPPEIENIYPEKLVLLPDCYQVNDNQQAIANSSISRAEYHLPEKGIVFCSMNANYKLNPHVFAIWMKLLHAVPDSVLWLYRDHIMVEHHLCREAQAAGIHPTRLIFADHAEKSKHLQRLQLADLFLDTLIVNAHTTASDALWAGLPVIAQLGNHFAGRVSASLLHAVGLPELICKNDEDYYDKALFYATHPNDLKALKIKLNQQKTTYPLFDTPRFTQHLEQGYQSMWQQFKAGTLENIHI